MIATLILYTRTGVYLSLKGSVYSNNSVIFVNEIGETNASPMSPHTSKMDSNALQTGCHVAATLTGLANGSIQTVQSCQDQNMQVKVHSTVAEA